MSGVESSMVDLVARERVRALEAEVRQVNARVDNLAQGAIEKVKGDTKLATRVEQLQNLIENLDQIVVRGMGSDPSMRAEMSSLRQDLNSLKVEFNKYKQEILTSDAHKTTLRVAEIESKDRRWSSNLSLVASVIAAIVAIIAAYYAK